MRITNNNAKDKPKWYSQGRIGQFIENFLPDSDLILLSSGLIVVCALVISGLFIITYSFLEHAPLENEFSFTLRNYMEVAKDPFYLNMFIFSFVVAVKSTIICVILGYPLGYYISIKSKRQNLLLLLLILPVWTNVVIRSFAWIHILGRTGLMNYLLVDVLAILNTPLRILYTETAVVIGLAYVFLPFFVLPLVSSLNNINSSQIEAAQNLNANSIDTLLEVIIPQSLPGFVAGTLITLILSFASFATPIILGGTQNSMISSIIALMFTKLFEWALGSALVVVFVALLTLIVFLVHKTVGLKDIYNPGDDG